MAWYVPDTHMRIGDEPTNKKDSTVQDASVMLPSPYHKPWYSSKFPDINGVADYWLEHYKDLRQNSALFRDAFYKSSLPPEVTEAIAANLTILKSPTVLRQYDGRFWAWEGSGDYGGSCHGSCTHVWNYAQAVSHLSLRWKGVFVTRNSGKARMPMDTRPFGPLFLSGPWLITFMRLLTVN